jgi:hypothetical protein
MGTEPQQQDKSFKMDALCELTAKTQCPNLGEYVIVFSLFYSWLLKLNIHTRLLLVLFKFHLNVLHLLSLI